MYDALEDWDYSCYTLGADVDGHTATGIGCYSFFRDAAVSAPMGINTNGAKNVNIDKALNVYLNGVNGSAINNLVDGDGKLVDSATQVTYHCEV